MLLLVADCHTLTDTRSPRSTWRLVSLLSSVTHVYGSSKKKISAPACWTTCRFVELLCLTIHFKFNLVLQTGMGVTYSSYFISKLTRTLIVVCCM
ncbi:hypothetical protein EB796_006872 [Bugula neritina]|uniref:Uncharacterized protein n=1 Tax=Bugula neritina TaxID=10212 RepID=A0A7J7K855_BUGNE|nr:hypothetical protein EB796_006872 [Bugula neritina]